MIGPGEVLQAFEVGGSLVGKSADRVDHHVGLNGLDAVGGVGLEHPDVAVLVEGGPLQVVVEPGIVVHPILAEMWSRYSRTNWPFPKYSGHG